MKDYKKTITSILKELGISANLSGFHYVRRGIELTINDTTLIKGIVKKLYPKIAKEFDTTPSMVERAIRHIIEVGFYKGNQDKLKELFGYIISADNGKVTNSEFIATIVDYIILKNQEETEVN